MGKKQITRYDILFFVFGLFAAFFVMIIGIYLLPQILNSTSFLINNLYVLSIACTSVFLILIGFQRFGWY